MTYSTGAVGSSRRILCPSGCKMAVKRTERLSASLNVSARVLSVELKRFKVGPTQWITSKLRKIDIERGHTAGRWAIRRAIPSSRGSSRRSVGGDHGTSLGDVVVDSGRKLREFSRVGKRGGRWHRGL